MTGIVGQEASRAVQVVVGVDTHQDEHVAVAIDRQGVRLGEQHSPATTSGIQGSRAMVPEPGRDQCIRDRRHGFLRGRISTVPDPTRLCRRRGQPT